MRNKLKSMLFALALVVGISPLMGADGCNGNSASSGTYHTWKCGTLVQVDILELTAYCQTPPQNFSAQCIHDWVNESLKEFTVANNAGKASPVAITLFDSVLACLETACPGSTFAVLIDGLGTARAGAAYDNCTSAAFQGACAAESASCSADQ